MRHVLALPALLALAACSGGSTATSASSASSAGSSTQQAEARVGDVVVHASAVQVTALDPAFVREHGLERSDRSVLLLVSVRRADGGDASGLPLSVTAQVAPEGAASQALTLREVRVDGLVDRIATVDVAPPETLRFDVSIRYGESTSTMQFSRTFFAK
jgi:hypothetical protein